MIDNRKTAPKIICTDTSTVWECACCTRKNCECKRCILMSQDGKL